MSVSWLVRCLLAKDSFMPSHQSHSHFLLLILEFSAPSLYIALSLISSSLTSTLSHSFVTHIFHLFQFSLFKFSFTFTFCIPNGHSWGIHQLMSSSLLLIYFVYCFAFEKPICIFRYRWFYNSIFDSLKYLWSYIWCFQQAHLPFLIHNHIFSHVESLVYVYIIWLTWPYI